MWQESLRAEVGTELNSLSWALVSEVVAAALQLHGCEGRCQPHLRGQGACRKQSDPTEPRAGQSRAARMGSQLVTRKCSSL